MLRVCPGAHISITISEAERSRAAGVTLTHGEHAANRLWPCADCLLLWKLIRLLDLESTTVRSRAKPTGDTEMSHFGSTALLTVVVTEHWFTWSSAHCVARCPTLHCTSSSILCELNFIYVNPQQTWLKSLCCAVNIIVIGWRLINY